MRSSDCAVDSHGDWDDGAEQASEALLVTEQSNPPFQPAVTRWKQTTPSQPGKEGSKPEDVKPMAWLTRLPKSEEGDLPPRKRRRMPTAR